MMFMTKRFRLSVRSNLLLKVELERWLGVPFDLSFDRQSATARPRKECPSSLKLLTRCNDVG